MRTPCSALVLAGLTACAAPEPLDLPDDPAASTMPVGVRTYTLSDATLEVWYPATANTEGSGEQVDLGDYLPDAFTERVPELDAPSYSTPALRDAPPRSLAEPLPVVMFSHGFGAFRTQSATLTAHLAARGYVVIAADHPGRMLTDIAPCLLSPFAGDCVLPNFGGGEDPAQAQLAVARAWLDDPDPELAPLIDTSSLGIFGHSAGGRSTAIYASENTEVDAALPLGGADAFSRDVPSAVIGGSCDAIIREPALIDDGATTSEGYYSLRDAGHLAFSDLCRIDLGELGAVIEARDDASALVAGLISLGTDGCPGYEPTVNLETCGDTFLDLDRSDLILKHAVTAFFDAHLRGEGGGLSTLTYPELVAPDASSD